MHRSILATQFALPLPSPSTSRHRSERASWHRFLFEDCTPEGLSTASIECGQPDQTRPFTPIGMANHAEVPSGLPIEDSGEEGSNGRPGKAGPVGGATAGG